MKRRYRGFSLVELMVALVIGSILIAGAVFVYVQSQRTYAVNETTARLQENARYVLSILEPDVQMAGYYGYSNLPNTFSFTLGGAATNTVSVANMRPTDPATPGLAAGAHVCGNNFAVNLIATTEGSNDAYTLACAPTLGPVRANTDTLTIRRASVFSNASPAPNTVVATNGRLQLVINRLSAAQMIFASGVLPNSMPLTADMNELRELRNLEVHTYLISSNSNNRPGVPSLRRKELVAGPGFAETEIMAGVEDLQVQFGYDTGDYDGNGVIDPDQDKDPIDGIPDNPVGVATRYVNPDGLPVGFPVVSVRLWVMMRAEQPELGFVDNRTYRYAGKVVTPNDAFRRVLVSRTIQLRNARIF